MRTLVEGVTFALTPSHVDQQTLSVVHRSDGVGAVEFVAESTGTSWSSGVLPVAPGVQARVPAGAALTPLQLRLFDDMGRELTAKARHFIGDGVIPKPRSDVMQIAVKGLVIFFALAAVWYFLVFHSSTPSSSIAPTLSPATTEDLPRLAILARSANLRSSPAIRKDNVVATLPFGTQLDAVAAVDGHFAEVKTVGGNTGFIHCDVAGEVGRVLQLGLQEPLLQAQSVADTRRNGILAAADKVRSHIIDASFLSSQHAIVAEVGFWAVTVDAAGDDVTGRFFHYLAQEAVAKANYQQASAYYRAAALVNPAAIADVHGWGVAQLRLGGAVEESAAFHAVVVAPRAATTWLMVAGYVAGMEDDLGSSKVANALRVAVSLSTERKTIRRLFTELKSSTGNPRLREALAEVVRQI